VVRQAHQPLAAEFVEAVEGTENAIMLVVSTGSTTGGKVNTAALTGVEHTLTIMASLMPHAVL
jgi:hypothetical protein